MENLENRIGNETRPMIKKKEYGARYDNIVLARDYSVFSEQYLEKPVISGDEKMAFSPTACTIKGIPVIDDF